MSIFIGQACIELRPNAGVSVEDGVIYWHNIDDADIPTEAEITAEVARLQAEYDNKEYQRQRATAYPPITDQLDQIYHEGVDAWKATILAVKEEFPK